MIDVRRYTFRIYPSPAQAVEMERQRILHQQIYNAALEERIGAYRKGIHLSFVDQSRSIKIIKAECPEFAAIHVHTLSETLSRLDKAYASFFRRVKTGKAAGFPRFQSRDRFSGWAYKAHKVGFWVTLRNGGKHGRLRLSGIGEMSMRGSMRDVGEIRTCNIVKRGDKWFASIVVRGEFKRECGAEACGMDWGVNTFATIATSQGELIKIENPRHGKRTAEKLAKRQRDLARKKRGSNRRNKAKYKIRRLHEKLKMQRHDFLHQVSSRLVKQFGMIATEQLNIAGMTRSAKGTVEVPGKRVAQKAGLNREILDTAPSAFLDMIRYKAESADCRMVEINTREHKPSQTCPVSGAVVKKTLSQRTHILPDGSVIGRDHAAAIVILNVALSHHGRETANAVKNCKAPG